MGPKESEAHLCGQSADKEGMHVVPYKIDEDIGIPAVQ